jgi:peptide-methionine (S)-S-oxide reductase
MPIKASSAGFWTRSWTGWLLWGMLPLGLIAVVWLRPIQASEPATIVPLPAVDESSAPSGLETAVLAGGCFWGVQAVFQHVNGVTRAVSGYAGGTKETASYQIVGSGATGHAESVQVTFDPRQISYGRILQIFFSVAHDPTQLGRQGPDFGPQYRSAIFYSNDTQRNVAETYIAQLNKAGVFRRPIVTEVNQLPGFYPAEDYHQDYATLHPSSPYIAFNDLPKVENLKHIFADLYREKPVLVLASNQTN